MSTERRQWGFLTLRVDDAMEYFRVADPGVGRRRCSSSTTLCGAEWTLEAYLSGSRLTTSIRYAGSEPFQDDWRFYVSSAVRVRKSKAEDDIQLIGGEISRKSTSLNSETNESRLRIDDLLKPAYGYLKDNAVTIVCSVLVKSYASSTFDAKRNCTDLRIVIGERHFHVSKGILASHCDYFEALLFGDVGERPKDEVSLDGLGMEVAPDEFATFMRVLLLEEAVDARNVAAVMPLASYLGAKVILSQCEEIVLEKLETAEAIRILDKSGIADLTEHLFTDVQMCDLEKLVSEDVLRTLSKTTSDIVTKELMRRMK